MTAADGDRRGGFHPGRARVHVGERAIVASAAHVGHCRAADAVVEGPVPDQARLVARQLHVHLFAQFLHGQSAVPDRHFVHQASVETAANTGPVADGQIEARIGRVVGPS